jgi:hypothetical protein
MDKIGWDFTTGKWLLNFVDAATEFQIGITTMAVSVFLGVARRRLFVYVADASGLLLLKSQNKSIKSLIKFEEEN